MNPYREANLSLWNEWTDLHVRSMFYGVPAFKAGACSLKRLEVNELGDVAGRSLLHLQCHFGLDTLSWCRRGVQATGVDFSPKAIALARSLAVELGLPAEFVESDIGPLRDRLCATFDIVFTSYGVLCWLDDLSSWAETIAHFLKPGGIFYIAEMHPFAAMFDEQVGKPVLRVVYPYFGALEPRELRVDGSYAGSHADGKERASYEWTHTMGDIVSALTDAGLRIEYLHEFPYCPYKMLPFMKQDSDGWWRLPEDMPEFPLLFSLMATKDSRSRDDVG